MRSFALTTLLLARASLAAPGPSVAFFYGSSLPVSELAQFSQVVVDPDVAPLKEVERLRQLGATPLAYVSVGEIDPKRAWSRGVPTAWRLGDNRAWKTAIVDPRQAGWRDRVVAEVARLRQVGYRGFFLDTLDSYTAAVKDPQQQRACAHALAQLIHAIVARVPDAKLLINRGFELLPEVAHEVAGVAAESLFAGWDPARQRFEPVSTADRQWLLAELRRAHEQFGLPVVVIDYLPASARAEARAIARNIAALDFTPFVTVPTLDAVGVGAVEVVPRRVLLVWDGGEAPGLAYSQVHQQLAPILEYLGYAVDYADARAELPEGPLAGRYAGIVTWFTDDELPRPERYRGWLLRQLEDALPVAILGHLGIDADAALLARLGVTALEEAPEGPLRLRQTAKLLGFEAQPIPRLHELVPWQAGPGLAVAASVEDARGRALVAVASGAFGGFALAPFVLQQGSDEGHRWVLDPFAFLTRALRLEPLPAADVTTESGRRLLTAHIDGDGFVSQAELPGRPFAGQVILDRILRVFDLPTTVSIIEGEIGPSGMHPAESPALEEIARRIFRLPNVELASHSYSHPFHWSQAAADAGSSGESFGLPIPGYRFNLEREVTGSVNYINQRLAPPGKRVKVFLWPGDALPGEPALKMAHELGLIDLNGGQSKVTHASPSLTGLSPMGLPVGDQYQTYAAISNENVYTNLWHGPYYGFRQAIETFELTERPRRLKPICIYYHFYSGSKTASLAALLEVYRWALGQETLPLYTSEYVPRVYGFNQGSFARAPDGALLLRGFGALRTLRLDRRLGWPDLTRSVGVAGVRELPAGRYLALTGEAHPRLYLQPEPPRGLYLESANAVVQTWRRLGDKRVEFRLAGHLPVELWIANGATCRLRGAAATTSRRGSALQLRFAQPDTGLVTLECP